MGQMKGVGSNERGQMKGAGSNKGTHHVDRTDTNRVESPLVVTSTGWKSSGLGEALTRI